MRRKALDRFLHSMDETDYVRSEIERKGTIDCTSLSQGMRDALIGLAIGRKEMLVDRLKQEGVLIDEEV